jgi:hypothetical protein
VRLGTSEAGSTSTGVRTERERPSADARTSEDARPFLRTIDRVKPDLERSGSIWAM